MARGGRGGRRGRGQGRPSKPVQNGRKPVQKDDDMMYDEVDRYHNAKQSLRLNAEDDAADSADDSALDAEAAVFDVDAADESSSEEDDQALEEDIQRGGRTAQMARTARALGMRLKQQAAEFGADEEDDEAEEEEDAAAGRGARWGASKRAYHGADTADASDDEEAAQEEEAEAVRLQREAAAALRPEDYADGLGFDGEGDEDGSGEDEDEDEPAERTMGGAAARAEAGVQVEEVEKDLDTMDEQAQRAAVAADAPELGALLAELRANLAEVRTRVGPLVKEVRAGQLATAEGVSYLEAKNLLLLSYCTHIVFYLLLKAEGRPVRTHPVIGRLLQIRAYLEKLRPIDKKLQYQMDKLLRAAAQLQQPGGGGGGTAAAAANTAAAGADPLSFGPNPDRLLPKVPLPRDGGGAAGATAEGGREGLAEGGDGLYRPPRNVAVSMEDDPDRRRSAKERRQERDHGKRAARSALLRELAHEVEGAPEEVGAAGAAAGMDSAVARRQLRQLEARAAAEEDLMMRVPLSKEQRKAVKAQRRAGLSGKALLDDFGDDVADLVDMADGLGRQSGNDGIDAGFKRTTISQRFGGALASAGLKGRTGDDDLPLREPLGERRAKYDAVRARQTAADDDHDGDDVLPGGAKRMRDREMDDTYMAVAEAAAAKKKARKAAHTAPALPPPLPEAQADGARGINQAIEKNRGLTPHRSKALKNPRKKHRIKFAEANVRRAGQVQPMREKSAGYGGEATGIKSKVSKSRRF